MVVAEAVRGELRRVPRGSAVLWDFQHVVSPEGAEGRLGGPFAWSLFLFLSSCRWLWHCSSIWDGGCSSGPRVSQHLAQFTRLGRDGVGQWPPACKRSEPLHHDVTHPGERLSKQKLGATNAASLGRTRVRQATQRYEARAGGKLSRKQKRTMFVRHLQGLEQAVRPLFAVQLTCKRPVRAAVLQVSFVGTLNGQSRGSGRSGDPDRWRDNLILILRTHTWHVCLDCACRFVMHSDSI